MMPMIKMMTMTVMMMPAVTPAALVVVVLPAFRMVTQISLDASLPDVSRTTTLR